MAYIRQTLKPGDLAYLDTMAGPVPCKVLRCWFIGALHKHGTFRPGGEVYCEVQVTADRAGFKRGERVSRWSLYVVPRKALRRGRIMPYDVYIPEVAA